MKTFSALNQNEIHIFFQINEVNYEVISIINKYIFNLYK